LAIILLANIFITNVLLAPAQPTTVTLSYDVFKQQVAADNVISVTTTGDAITGVTKTPVKEASTGTSATHFTTQHPSFANDGLETLLEQHNVTINAKPANPPPPLWLTLLLSFGPTLAFRHYTNLPTFDLFDLTPSDLDTVLAASAPTYLLLDEQNVQDQWLGQAPAVN